MYLSDLREYVSLGTKIVPIIKHPFLNCFIEIKTDIKTYTSSNKVEKLHVDGSCLYVKLDFDAFIRDAFDEWGECCLVWHQVYTAKTIQELLLLDEKGYFVGVLEDLNL